MIDLNGDANNPIPWKEILDSTGASAIECGHSNAGSCAPPRPGMPGVGDRVTWRSSGLLVLLFRSLRLPLRWPHGIAAYLAGYFLGLAFIELTTAAMMLVQMEKPVVLPKFLMVGIWSVLGGPTLWLAFRSQKAGAASPAT